jgi:hypothetical protein
VDYQEKQSREMVGEVAMSDDDENFLHGEALADSAPVAEYGRPGRRMFLQGMEIGFVIRRGNQQDRVRWPNKNDRKKFIFNLNEGLKKLKLAIESRKKVE